MSKNNNYIKNNLIDDNNFNELPFNQSDFNYLTNVSNEVDKLNMYKSLNIIKDDIDEFNLLSANMVFSALNEFSDNKNKLFKDLEDLILDEKNKYNSSLLSHKSEFEQIKDNIDLYQKEVTSKINILKKDYVNNINSINLSFEKEFNLLLNELININQQTITKVELIKNIYPDIKSITSLNNVLKTKLEKYGENINLFIKSLSNSERINLEKIIDENNNNLLLEYSMKDKVKDIILLNESSITHLLLSLINDIKDSYHRIDIISFDIEKLFLKTKNTITNETNNLQIGLKRIKKEISINLNIHTLEINRKIELSNNLINYRMIENKELIKKYSKDSNKMDELLKFKMKSISNDIRESKDILGSKITDEILNTESNAIVSINKKYDNILKDNKQTEDKLVFNLQQTYQSIDKDYDNNKLSNKELNEKKNKNRSKINKYYDSLISELKLDLINSNNSFNETLKDLLIRNTKDYKNNLLNLKKNNKKKLKNTNKELKELEQSFKERIKILNKLKQAD